MTLCRHCDFISSPLCSFNVVEAKGMIHLYFKSIFCKNKFMFSTPQWKSILLCQKLISPLSAAINSNTAVLKD